MEENTIAKKNKNEVAEATQGNTSTGDTATETTMDSGRPELPEGETGTPPMSGGFPGEMMTGAVTSTNEWLVPMTCTGIISGVIILATVAICLTIYCPKKIKH